MTPTPRNLAPALARLGAVALALSAGSCGPSRSLSRSAPRVPATSSPAEISPAALFAAHNRLRETRGLSPFGSDPVLARVAQAHAEDMAARRRMSHRGSDGSSPFERMGRAGYSFTRAAENVASGQPNVDDVMAAWMRSPGHRRNVLGKFSAIGTGRATGGDGTPYWCVTFGTPAGP